MIKRLKYFLSSLLLFASIYAMSQTLPKYYFDTKMHYGFIMSHSPTMRYITRTHFGIYELSISKQCSGKKYWHHLYHLPNYGLTTIYTGFNKNQFFGHSAGLAGHFNFRIYNGKVFKSAFKLGLGISYTQNVYEPTLNYKNTALATPFNALIILHFNQSVYLNRYLDGVLGFGMTHYSNGNFKKPNRGINILTLNAGIKIKSGKTEIIKGDTLPQIKRKMFFTIREAAGVKEIYPPIGKKYFANTISFSTHYLSSLKNAWGLGLEYLYDASLLDELNKDSLISTNKNIVNRIAVYPNYQLMVGNTAIELGWGVYLYDQFKLDGNFYQRIGLRHYFKSNWFCNFSLKTHFANADYFEWGFGYRFY